RAGGHRRRGAPRLRPLQLTKNPEGLLPQVEVFGACEPQSAQADLRVCSVSRCKKFLSEAKHTLCPTIRPRAARAAPRTTCPACSHAVPTHPRTDVPGPRQCAAETPAAPSA